MRYGIALWGFALVLGGCGSKKEEAAPEAVARVQVAAVEREPINRLVAAEAILYPIKQTSVTSKISAPVKNFLVTRGDHVKQGQLLAVLENRDLAAAVADAKGAYDQASAAFLLTTRGTMPEDLTKAETDVKTAQQTVDAARKLYENRLALLKEGALAQKLVDDAHVALVQAQSQLATSQQHLQSLRSVSRTEQVKGAQAQVDSARAKYQSAQAQLSYAEIRSPINGIVSDRPINVGEMASSGNAIISLVDISQVVARANIPIKDAAALRAGKSATITSPDGGEVAGKVTVVSPAVDANTTTVEVWVQAANPLERMKPGTTVKVSILAETIPDAVVAPVAALLTADEGGDKVMVVGSDSLAHEKKVEVGVREQEKAQILKGVSTGERVVTVGGLGLEDKAKVIVDKAGAAAEKETHE